MPYELLAAPVSSTDDFCTLGALATAGLSALGALDAAFIRHLRHGWSLKRHCIHLAISAGLGAEAAAGTGFATPTAASEGDAAPVEGAGVAATVGLNTLAVAGEPATGAEAAAEPGDCVGLAALADPGDCVCLAALADPRDCVGRAAPAAPGDCSGVLAALDS